MNPTYARNDVTWCMVVWCTQNAPRRQQFHVAPAMRQPIQRCKYITSVDIQNALWKAAVIQNHMQQECNESARELRIALYKCDQQQQHRSASRQINETAGDCGCGEDEAGIKRRNVWRWMWGLLYEWTVMYERVTTLCWVVGPVSCYSTFYIKSFNSRKEIIHLPSILRNVEKCILIGQY